MLTFILGMMAGGAVGVFIMCFCQISGAASRREEEWFSEEGRHGDTE